MRSLALGSLVSLVSLVACSSATAPSSPPRSEAPAPEATGPAPTAKTAAQLEPTTCRFVIPRSVEGKAIRCADLKVPENRRVADGKTITIHVAIVKGREGGVPTLELNGGPGGGSDGIVGPLVAGDAALLEGYAPILAQGDLVLFDQRGTGRSIPRLSCAAGASSGSPASCAKALSARGVDLAAYDTVENADDVHDLVVALGGRPVDLHGISYGTRLGIEVMKRHPADVRASILDGVLPPDVPVGGMFPVAIDGILTRVFGACAADAKCNAAYPDLDGALGRLKVKLDATPFSASDPEWGNYDYDWRAFVGELQQRLYVDGEASAVPLRVTSLLAFDQAGWDRDAARAAAEDERRRRAEDDAAAKNPLLSELYGRYERMTEDDYDAMGMADGMYLSVTCNDYIQHETLDGARALQEKIRPVLRDDDDLREELGMCKGWPVRPSEDGARAASTFAGPTLVIGGRLDPATPYFWAEHVASSLPTHALVLIPTGAHGAVDACAGGLKGAFLADPARPLDAKCATDRALSFRYDQGGVARVTERARALSAAARVTRIVPLAKAPPGLPRASARAAIALAASRRALPPPR